MTRSDKSTEKLFSFRRESVQLVTYISTKNIGRKICKVHLKKSVKINLQKIHETL